MNNSDLRLEALRLANSTSSLDADSSETVKRAEDFYRFLSGAAFLTVTGGVGLGGRFTSSNRRKAAKKK